MRVWVESYGCAQNQGEGHAIERELHAHGHTIAPAPEGADLGILVTCGVIGATESRMVARWRSLTATVPRVVVTGCLVPLRTEALAGPGRDRTTFVPIREQGGLPGLVDAWDGGAVRPSSPPGGPPAQSPSEEVVISQGCTSACSYCFSRLARGRLASVPLAPLLDRIRAARDRGAVEIRLSSLDTSCWGEDVPGGPRLPELLREASGLPGEFRLRVGMMSPQSLSEIAGTYFATLAESKAFRFLHLPVQSGSEGVLRDMHRGYTVDQFRAIVRAARDVLPDLLLATDVIVGYPFEGPADVEATVRLLEETGPEIVNVTRFSPRPGTPAAALRPWAPSTVKRRSRDVVEAKTAIGRRRLERWIGWEGTGLVLEHGVDGSSVARLPNYLPAVLPDRLPLGTWQALRIDGARSTYLLGEARPPPDPPSATAPA